MSYHQVQCGRRDVCSRSKVSCRSNDQQTPSPLHSHPGRDEHHPDALSHLLRAAKPPKPQQSNNKTTDQSAGWSVDQCISFNFAFSLLACRKQSHANMSLIFVTFSTTTDNDQFTSLFSLHVIFSTFWFDHICKMQSAIIYIFYRLWSTAGDTTFNENEYHCCNIC